MVQLSCYTKHHRKGNAFVMNTVTQTMQFRQSLMNYAEKHGVTKAAIKYNGKVERSHRKDNEYFYASHKFYSFSDFKKQLAVHSRKYNHFPIRPLGWLDPLAFLAKYRNQPSAPAV